MTKDGDPAVLEAAAAGGTVDALITWATESYINPMDVVLCEETTYSADGGVVTRWWFESKQ